MLCELTANCCRICLGKAKKLRSLYKPVDEEDEPPYEMLLKVTGIEVEQEDKHTMLPKTICKNCEMSLSMAFEFREKALQSHEILMSYVGEIKKPHQQDEEVEKNETLPQTSEPQKEVVIIKNEEAARTLASPRNCEEEASTYVENVVIEHSTDARNSGDNLERRNEEEMEAKENNKEEPRTENLEYEENDFNQEEFCSNSENEGDNDHNYDDEEMEITSIISEHEIDVIQQSIEDEVLQNQELGHNTPKKKRKCSKLKESKTTIEIVKDNSLCEENEVQPKLARKGKENESCGDREKVESIEIDLKVDGVDELHVKPLNSRRRGKPREDGSHAYICDICGNVFSKRGRMMEHRQRHDKRPKYSCELCDKKFHMRELLRKHMFSHSGGKPHKCEYCSRTFYYESVKKAHEAVHQGLKPYICDVCGKAFSYGHSLKKHKLIHAEVKLYRCEYCNKDFRLQHHMKQHELTKAHRREVQLAGGTIDYQETLTPNEEEEVFTIMVEEEVTDE
ncbi:putative zinc finger protein 735 [Musca domestica]|uniref:Zinc finger protein 735 n=1 Tax=Musca domestica TaxID=7370 RepID=A0ABM3VGT5_MUSDO|nr:putative zinc finger protein 735 [Musca domestica]